jgi:hypothetical protein
MALPKIASPEPLLQQTRSKRRVDNLTAAAAMFFLNQYCARLAITEVV